MLWSVMHSHGKIPEMVNLKEGKIVLDLKFKTLLPMVLLLLLLDESIMAREVYYIVLVLFMALGKQREVGAKLSIPLSSLYS